MALVLGSPTCSRAPRRSGPGAGVSLLAVLPRGGAGGQAERPDRRPCQLLPAFNLSCSTLLMAGVLQR
jgi:hypothetical protein